ncbi:hypothetical protein [Metaclostridioides mangenotii]|uniref:Lipoprotein n=1 Tax=Metaclostridioides mangenotii TaxID=1540 RepID=A0ABS4E8X3_9FIRM|nr:hypothetical protein [Clostridioides mangenotii]MBP1854395.1 hypothetical protein [Clostridioides mangenotii]
MSNMLKRIILIFSLIVFIIGLVYIVNDISKKYLSANDKNSIKDVVEVFVKEDYNFNGGKNTFSTVASDEFKQYLKARNDLKKTNNDINGYKPFEGKFEFDFKSITKYKDTVKVNVYVSENFSYDSKGEIVNDAGAGNDYVIYLSKLDDSWKIMSATIDANVDPVDSYFNVNKELGYEKNKGQKNNDINENLKKMLKKIYEIKINLYS